VDHATFVVKSADVWPGDGVSGQCDFCALVEATGAESLMAVEEGDDRASRCVGACIPRGRNPQSLVVANESNCRGIEISTRTIR
jgi:hypothetical protein